VWVFFEEPFSFAGLAPFAALADRSERVGYFIAEREQDNKPSSAGDGEPVHNLLGRGLALNPCRRFSATMNFTMLDKLKGKRTYYCAAVAIVYIVGAFLGFYELDEKVLVALGFGGLAFLRAAIHPPVINATVVAEGSAGASPHREGSPLSGDEIAPASLGSPLSGAAQLRQVQREEIYRDAMRRGSASMILLFGAVLVGLVTGCASFVTDQRDITYEAITNGTKTASVPTREIRTRAKARTFWDAKSALARFRASQTDKSQTATVGELGMETSGTNAIAVLDRLATIVKALPK
jgi:hypothetical protein